MQNSIEKKSFFGGFMVLSKLINRGNECQVMEKEVPVNVKSAASDGLCLICCHVSINQSTTF